MISINSTLPAIPQIVPAPPSILLVVICLLCGCLLAIAAWRDLRTMSVPMIWWLPGTILAAVAMLQNTDHAWAFGCMTAAVFAGCLLRLYAGADMWALIISTGVLMGCGGPVLAFGYIAATVCVSVGIALMNLIPATMAAKTNQCERQIEDILLEKSSILLHKIPLIPTLAIGYWVSYLIYLIIVFRV